MGKTKRKRRPLSEQKQTKEQLPQRGFQEITTKQKQAVEKVPQRSFKNARRHSFSTMKNPMTKNNPDSFLEVALS